MRRLTTVQVAVTVRAPRSVDGRRRGRRGDQSAQEAQALRPGGRREPLEPQRGNRDRVLRPGFSLGSP